MEEDSGSNDNHARNGAGNDDDDDDDDGGGDNDDDDDDDDSDGADSNESEWERTNGYRADTTAFTYRYMSSDDEREPTDNAGQPFYQGLLARAFMLRRLAHGRADEGNQDNDEE